MTKRTRVVRIFYCHDPADKAFLADLEIYLRPLERSGQIETWSERKIPGGANRKHEIEKHLNVSDVVLLLVSPEFLASDHCQMIQQQATELHRTGKISSIIPIIIRPADWKHGILGELQCLPKDGVPISIWENRDDAFLNVGMEIKNVIETLLSIPQQQADKMKEQFMFIGEHPVNGYRWDNDLRPAPGFVKQGNIPDAPWLVSHPIGILEISQRYSLFEEENVLRDFSTLSPTEEAIKHFADRYGFLGHLEPLYYPQKVGQPDSVLWAGESLQFWQDEIEKMSSFMTLWEMIQSRQLEALKEHIIWRLDPIRVMFIWQYQTGTMGSLITSKEISPELLNQWEYGEVIRPAFRYLCTAINKQLEGHISPVLFPSIEDAVNMYMVPDCLLSALYTLLSLKVTSHQVKAE